MASPTPSINKIILISLILSMSVCCFPTALPAGDFSEDQVLILQSNDTRIKAGELLSTTATVRLAPKEMLRAMTSSGEVMKITGAYTGSIGGALHSGGGSNINISDLAKAVAGRGESRNALGAYRGSGQTTGPPRYKESVIRIVVGDKHGAYCISPGQRLVLWRPKAAQSAFTVVIETGKIKKEISWPAGAVEVGVPDDVLENKPRRIVLTPDDSTGATRARLWFGEYGDTPGEQLKWYESRSCHTQFESALTYYQTF